MNLLGLKDSDLTLFVSGFEIDVIYVMEKQLPSLALDNITRHYHHNSKNILPEIKILATMSNPNEI